MARNLLKDDPLNQKPRRKPDLMDKAAYRGVGREVPESTEEPVDTGTRKPVRAEVREDGGTGGSEDVRADLRTRIRERLLSKAEMLTGVKATIDMSPELSKRVKRYGLDHKGGSLRQMCVVFLEEFLDEEGY